MTAAIIICLYGGEAAINRGFDSIYSTISKAIPVHVLNQHYPLWQPGYAESLRDKYNFTLHDAGSNLGLAGGLQYVLDKLDVELMLCCDCDVCPVTPGWDQALLMVLQHPKVAWATIKNKKSYEEMEERGYDSVIINGYYCRIPHKPVINSCSGHKVSWLKSIGGFRDQFKMYGGSEAALFPFTNNENQWVFLDDFEEISYHHMNRLHEPVYQEWKVKHVTGIFTGSFEEYLFLTDWQKKGNKADSLLERQ